MRPYACSAWAGCWSLGSGDRTGGAMRLTAKRLTKIGCGPNCENHKKFLEVFPQGAEVTWGNIEKALAAGLEVGRLAEMGVFSRAMTLRLLPTLAGYWRSRVFCDCPRLTREDVLAALPTLDVYWRGRVVRDCPRLLREDVLAALPMLDAYWRGVVVCDCPRLLREDVLAALPTLNAYWRGEVVSNCPQLTADDREC